MRWIITLAAASVLATAAHAGDLGLNSDRTPVKAAPGGNFKFSPAEEQYKKTVAKHILTSNKYGGSKAGYRNITVVGYTVDKKGGVTDTWVVRSSGDQHLDQTALTTFKKALPLPMPPGHLFGSDPQAHFSEAFVHTSDGGYKLQTLLQ